MGSRLSVRRAARHGQDDMARVLAKAVNCQAPSPSDWPCNACENCQAVNEGRFLDLIEIDAASNTSVEDVRDLREKINFTPNRGRFKVYIIDEVHMLSTAAFNALLKTLEEPPPHAIFVLATTEVHKIPATVLSRCQRHEFRRLPVAMRSSLRQVQAQGMEVERPVLQLIARQATGSMRDAISLLDQLVSTGDAVTLDFARTVLGTASNEYVVEIVRAIAEDDVARGLEGINLALDSGADPRHLARQVVEYLRGLLLVQSGNADRVDVPEDVASGMLSLAERLSLADLLTALRAFCARRSGNARHLATGPAARTGAGRGCSLSGGGPAGQQRPGAARRPDEGQGGAILWRARYEERRGGCRLGSSKPAADELHAADRGHRPLAGRSQGGVPSGSARPGAAELMQAVGDREGQGGARIRERSPAREDGEGTQSGLRAGGAARGDGGAFGGSLCAGAGARRQAGSAEPEGAPPAEPVEEGGMVATAIRDLGAQVMDVKPLPTEGNA